MKISEGSAVTVGTFDGVHCGHRLVLDTLCAEASARGLQPVVVTFDRHPLETVSPARAPRLVMDMESRDAMLRAAGVEVERVAFTEEVRRMTSREWLARLARERGMKLLVLGYDNTFGCDGIDMSVEDYERIGRDLGVEVILAPRADGCSSSQVRRAVQQGDMERAREILGRPFSLRGEVMHGREIGRTIGVPTANLKVSAKQLLPAAGVYCAEVLLPGGERRRAVANVGSNPTVTDSGVISIEVHILDFEGNLYGSEITVEFGRRIREEKKFNTLEDLRLAIAHDIAECQQYSQRVQTESAVSKCSQ